MMTSFIHVHDPRVHQSDFIKIDIPKLWFQDVQRSILRPPQKNETRKRQAAGPAQSNPRTAGVGLVGLHWGQGVGLVGSGSLT